ncbi:ArsR/SmtB family transcription factor [Gymnodinialimonas sp.]
MSALDRRFAALADPTRRQILHRLGQGEATVQQLASVAEMSQPAISHHLKVLEAAELVETRVVAQTRPRRLRADALTEMAAWLAQMQAMVEGNYQRLDAVLADMQSPRSPTPPNEEP